MKWSVQQEIFQMLKNAGFIAVGASHAGPVDERIMTVFDDWIGQGYHHRLTWLEKNRHKRNNPAVLIPGTRTVISMLHPWPETEFDTGVLKIAGYAHGEDYHEYLKKAAQPAITSIAAADPGFKPVFVTDSSAMFDRYWAWNAGLGFIGKNGFLIHPLAGSRVLIAHLLTSLVLDETGPPPERNCGDCNQCRNSCPTSAFLENGTLHVEKCIACHNIESKAALPDNIGRSNPGWIFGCDICQQVCPFNHRPVSFEGSLKMKGNWRAPADINEWNAMDENEFSHRFAHTPLARAGLKKIQNTLSQLFSNSTK